METPSKKKKTLCGGNDSKIEKAKESPVASSSSSSSSQSTQNGTFKSPITSPMLTPEDWDLIFRDLKSKDFQSVINTCPEWNHLLHSRKGAELLPLVLPILMEFGHLHIQEVLNCRKINKESKSGIDDTIGQEISTPSKCFKNDMKRRCQEDRFGDIEMSRQRFSSRMRIQEFISHVESRPMSSSITNPFLTRNMLINLEGRRVNFTPLFSQYGHHLWRLAVRFWPCARSNEIDTLLSLLTMTPNLKMLKIINGPDDSKKTPNNIIFPALPHMESLDFENFFNPRMSREESTLIQFLENYGSQLTAFRCRGDLLQEPGLEADFLNRVAPNVKQFSLNQLTGEFGHIFPLSLGELGTFYQLKWPVEHFHLFNKEHHNSYDTKTKTFIHHLNAAVSQFSNTLVRLDLLVKLKKRKSFARIKDKLKGEVLPKLKIMKCLKSNVLVLLPEFWSFIKLRCGELRELHLSCCSETCCFENYDAETRASFQAFQKLPKLDRILFWPWNNNGEYSIYVKSYKPKPVIWTRRDFEKAHINNHKLDKEVRVEVVRLTAKEIDHYTRK